MELSARPEMGCERTKRRRLGARVVEQELFGELAVIGGLAVATTLGLHRLGLPATAGFLVTGAIAGPYGPGLVSDAHRIEQIAEIGVILLLFAIGLEFSLSRWRPSGR